jgi:hypothetical protein
MSIAMYVHPTVAVTPERLCLGVLDAWNWAREPGRLGAQGGSPRPIEEKESIRWLEGYQRVNEQAAALPDTQLVYVADREADIYELFAEGQKARAQGQPSADWLVRGQQDRCLAAAGKLKAAVHAAPVLTTIEFDLPSRQGGKARHVHQQLKVAQVRLKPPYRAGCQLDEVTVTVLLAEALDPPRGQEPLTWVLLTNRSVVSAEQAAELLSWYLCRWQIGVSGQGPVIQSVKVRPRRKDSSLVAGEAPWRESKTVKPSDNTPWVYRNASGGNVQ